jgi:hypothetical protein
MSGGCDNMKHSVEITAKPALVAPPLNKLNQAKLTQEVQVALNSSHRPIEDFGQ